MLKALKYLFAPQAHDQTAYTLYIAAVEAARSPHFYRDLGVADTVDGRFDIIILHLFLITHALRTEGSPAALETSRALAELFFADMDRSLREMGAGDTGVGRRVKNMAQAMYGRVQTYEDGLADPALLEAAIARNIYRGGEAKGAAALAEYIRANAKHLAQPEQSAQIIKGNVAFI